ncbi:MAG: DNA-3-methyladenine glycosylase family protein [Acidimicrobiales bacterium]
MAIRRIELEAPAPFRLDLCVWTLRRRAHNAVDRWDGTTYRRVVTTEDGPIALAVRQESGPSGPLAVELCTPRRVPSDSSAIEARRLLERMLGLGVDLRDFYAFAERDHRLAALVRRFAGMRPPRFPSVFEALVNAVACQQLSLTVGIHLLNRLANRYGERAGGPGEHTAFPTPERLAAVDPDELRSLGFSHAKSRAITFLAQGASRGADFEGFAGLSDEGARSTLMALPGIGRWSTEYTMLRGLGRLHVLPGDDVGARNNLHRRFGLVAASYDDVAELSRSWWPYGGLVYFHLLLDALDDAGELCVTGGAAER